MKIKQTLLAIALLIWVGVLFLSPTVSAATCGGVDTSIINCDQAGGKGSTVQNSGLWGILLLVINILTAGIGIVAVGGIIYGSILYASAGGSPDQVKKAKTIIINIVIGLLAFALMYSFLNFIIPGGLFS